MPAGLEEALCSEITLREERRREGGEGKKSRDVKGIRKRRRETERKVKKKKKKKIAR